MDLRESGQRSFTLIGAVDVLAADEAMGQLPFGTFGASTGAAAALIAAAERPSAVQAVVSRGGRPDLAASALARVRAPTLLIVGGEDTHVIQLNEAALAQLTGEKQLAIVPGASSMCGRAMTFVTASRS